MAKAPALRTEVQKRIALARIKNPKLSYTKLARRHNCTASQARYACQLYNSGRLGGSSRANPVRVAEIKSKLREKSTSSILQEMVFDTIAEIQASPKIEIKDRTNLIRSLSAASKQLLDSVLTVQIKNPDAQRVAAMVRMIDPTLTDEQIIELWKRSDEIAKA